MTAESGALLVVVWIPLVAVWAIVMIDLVRQPALSRAARVSWAIACTLVWPALIAYLLMRPTRGRLVTPEARTDRRSRLVDAALDHEAGRLDDATMDLLVRGLRGR